MPSPQMCMTKSDTRYILNLFNVFPGCREDQIFETETVYVGDDVNLTCTRKGVGNLVWARLASGKAPQALGKSFSLKTVHPRITTSEESETFVLHITKARLSDTAFYFCINKQQQSSIFLKGTALLNGAELDVTADPSPAPCHPGDSVTLQCSLLSDSENKTCSEENSVCCFRAGSHQSHQSFYHTHIFDEYKRNPEGFSRKKCVYSFFKNISSSDAGTCYCAVATCEEIFSGNGTKLDIEGNCKTFLDKWQQSQPHSRPTVPQVPEQVGLILVLNQKNVQRHKALGGPTRATALPTHPSIIYTSDPEEGCGGLEPIQPSIFPPKLNQVFFVAKCNGVIFMTVSKITTSVLASVLSIHHVYGCFCGDRGP
uniref:Ig-like domain-containing protein n=1 Tax=Monopterus albus TaxID=43700 RepID=A0A3Q3J0G0_MONAL